MTVDSLHEVKAASLKGLKMNTNWKITEASGTEEQIIKLISEAITMASATGSTGASVTSKDWDSKTGKTTTVASATVARIYEGVNA